VRGRSPALRQYERRGRDVCEKSKCQLAVRGDGDGKGKESRKKEKEKRTHNAFHTNAMSSFTSCSVKATSDAVKDDSGLLSRLRGGTSSSNFSLTSLAALLSELFSLSSSGCSLRPLFSAPAALPCGSDSYEGATVSFSAPSRATSTATSDASAASSKSSSEEKEEASSST
jgi:hypothetical protein